MTPTLPPGFDIIKPGSGRVSDLSVAYRRVGSTMFRLVVSLGKRTLSELGINTAQNCYGVFGVNAAHTKMVMLLSQESMAGDITGNVKDGVVYFNVRLERLLEHRIKHPAEAATFEVQTQGGGSEGVPVHTITFDLPMWVQGAIGPDNSASAAMERARKAAALARDRARGVQ